MMRKCRPKRVRIEASTACQLRCPACATTQGKTATSIGIGFLKPDQFRRILAENPWIEEVELSNWGEIFLNPEFLQIMKTASEYNVLLYADNGSNFNTVAPTVLEGLVTYGFQRISISIDGATEETYRTYRRQGSFSDVINNIKTLNELKKLHNSVFPQLTWHFIAFHHNEHEILTAMEMARDLGMGFNVKIAWDDLFDETESFAPVQNKELVRRYSNSGVADRKEYFDKFGSNYLQKTICGQLWHTPQINWDGRLLGCCRNYWGDFGNVFEEGLEKVVDGEAFTYAKRMLLGQVPARQDIPCSSCKHYLTMRETDTWLGPEDVPVD